MPVQPSTAHFQDSVVYQIYVRSFADSNGDGMGDLRGILDKLPYLESLGVRYLWLNPVYPSPQKDNGYDISDYQAIDSRFGTMADFDELVVRARERGIGIIMDMVFNHTSTEHPWFRKALAGDRKYRAYYFFREALEDGGPPCNWQSKFGGSAWEKVPNEDTYYLHLYAREQADLDWTNPDVREELFNVLRFWRKKGVAGFRFDVVNVISKPETFENDMTGDGRRLYTDGPLVETYLRMIHEVLAEDEAAFGRALTVGELSSTSMERASRYGGADTAQLSMVFHFHHLKSDYADPNNKWIPGGKNFPKLRDLLHNWQVAMQRENAWDALFWNNHDQPRALTRFASSKREFHYASATLLAAAIHFQRGIPYIYQGEEIGMINPDFPDISCYRDVETLNVHRYLREKGTPEAEIMQAIHARSRDNSRTPMQWDDSAQAGFTTGTPWITVADNKSWINVRDETARPDGIFAFYRRLAALRREKAVVRDGDYAPLFTDRDNVFAYARHLDNETLVSLNNFAEAETTIPWPDLEKALGGEGRVLLGNYRQEGERIAGDLRLRPYETATVVREAT